ncbi:hypothetical protein GGR55DRAFT_675963 [Xylaria sp. FL0064]|nr:hypothetical protein GGR55DRAFT_675963 [Xylaria sp. FL0064]
MARHLHRNDTDIVLGAPYLNRGAGDMKQLQAVSHAILWHHIKTTGADQDKTTLYPYHPLFDIIVTFHDHRKNSRNKWTSIQGLEPIITYSKGSKFLLLVEFSAVEDGVMLLRMEYDNECILEREIERVQQLIIAAMSMILGGRGCSETEKAHPNFSVTS